MRWLSGLVVLLLPRVALGEGPAVAECTAWMGAGGGTRLVGSELFTIGEVNAGAEMTFQTVTFGPKAAYGGLYEIRMGPWLQAAFASREALAEAGAKVSFTQLSHAPFGTYDIRFGAGAGSTETPWPFHVVVTATGGVRSFPNRYRQTGVTPTGLAFGSVLRVFLTTRIRTPAPAPWQSPWEITAGIELEPSFLAPPYSWQRLAGASY